MTRAHRISARLRRLLRRALDFVFILDGFLEFERIVRSFDRAPRIVEQTNRFSKHTRLEVKRALIDRRLFVSASKGFHVGARKCESLETSSELWSTVIVHWCKSLDLVKRYRNYPVERIAVVLKRGPLRSRTSRFHEGQRDRGTRPNDLEPLGYPSCDQLCSPHVVSRLLLTLPNSKHERDENSSARPKCYYTVHDDARGIYVHPFGCTWPFKQAFDEMRRQASNSERQQRYRAVFDRGAQGIPVLHFFPVFDFVAIVARSAEGAWAS